MAVGVVVAVAVAVAVVVAVAVGVVVVVVVGVGVGVGVVVVVVVVVGVGMSTPAKRGGRREPLQMDEDTIRAVAEGSIDLKTQVQIGEALGISAQSVARLKKSPQFKELAKEVFQSHIAGLAGHVALLLERELKQGNLEAVALWLKAMGITGQPKQIERGGDNNSFTIILPGTAPLQVQAKPDIVVVADKPEGEENGEVS